MLSAAAVFPETEDRREEVTGEQKRTGAKALRKVGRPFGEMRSKTGFGKGAPSRVVGEGDREAEQNPLRENRKK